MQIVTLTMQYCKTFRFEFEFEFEFEFDFFPGFEFEFGFDQNVWVRTALVPCMQRVPENLPTSDSDTKTCCRRHSSPR